GQAVAKQEVPVASHRSHDVELMRLHRLEYRHFFGAVPRRAKQPARVPGAINQRQNSRHPQKKPSPHVSLPPLRTKSQTKHSTMLGVARQALQQLDYLQPAATGRTAQTTEGKRTTQMWFLS